MDTSTPTVRDLIVLLKDYPHINSEQTVHQAVALLFAQTINGSGKLLYEEVLVISDQQEYIGRLTIRTILTCFFPTLFPLQHQEIYSGKKERFSDLAILLEENFQAECKRQGALPVRQCMASPHQAVRADLHPLHVAEIMMEENENCLPVVEHGALIGVVRLVDVFRFLAGHCSF